MKAGQYGASVVTETIYVAFTNASFFYEVSIVFQQRKNAKIDAFFLNLLGGRIAHFIFFNA